MSWREFFGMGPALDEVHPGHTRYQAIFWIIVLGCGAAYAYAAWKGV